MAYTGLSRDWTAQTVHPGTLLLWIPGSSDLSLLVRAGAMEVNIASAERLSIRDCVAVVDIVPSEAEPTGEGEYLPCCRSTSQTVQCESYRAGPTECLPWERKSQQRKSALSLSLSLSHTHTHTQIQYRARERERERGTLSVGCTGAWQAPCN